MRAVRRPRARLWGLVGVVLLGAGAPLAPSGAEVGHSEIGDDGTEFCVGPILVQGVEAEVCEFPFNWEFEVPDDYAVSGVGAVIQAVGGAGGSGGSLTGSTTGGGGGGTGGLAQTTLDASTLQGETLYVYVGNDGDDGAEEKGGSGGAATVVSTAELDPSAREVADSVLVVAGGGGGGQGYDGSSGTGTDGAGADGGAGGVAITTDAFDQVGSGSDGSPQPYTGTPDDDLDDGKVLDVGVAGEAPSFDSGAWAGGAAGGNATAGSEYFAIAGGAGSSGSVSWVRETDELMLGTSALTVEGTGDKTGGAGGGGLAGGGGSEYGGGGGGASWSVGSGDFDVPCTPSDPDVLCLDNWLTTADDDEPKVVITFFQDTESEESTPADGATIDTDQPLLSYAGDTSDGVVYNAQSTDSSSTTAVYSSVQSPDTGASAWSPPWEDMLEVGVTYEWWVTNLDGTTVQDPQTFTVGSDEDDTSSGNGWGLFLRSMDCEDSSLDSSMQPLGTDGCSTTCDGTNTGCQPWPTVKSWTSTLNKACEESGSCTDLDYTMELDNPTSDTYWVWDLDSDSGTYANSATTSADIDFEWSADTNPISSIFPSRLIDLTSAAVTDGDTATTPEVADGDAVHVLSVPVDGDYTFTTQSNGGMRLWIWADTDGSQADDPVEAVDAWDIASCSWTTTSDEDVEEDVAKVEAEEVCQNDTDVVESDTYSLEAGTDYLVQVDGVVPYLQGPMVLGYTYDESTWSAPLPAWWITRCTWDADEGACELGLGTGDPDPDPTTPTSSTTTTTTTSTTAPGSVGGSSGGSTGGTGAAAGGQQPAATDPTTAPVAARPGFTG